MRTMLINKRPFFHCKKNKQNLFDEPIKRRLNYMPIFSLYERQVMGPDYNMHLRIRCTAKEAYNFSNEDRLYINVLPPEEHDELCDTADYVVYGAPKISVNHAEIMLRKLSGDVKHENY